MPRAFTWYSHSLSHPKAGVESQVTVRFHNAHKSRPTVALLHSGMQSKIRCLDKASVAPFFCQVCSLCRDQKDAAMLTMIELEIQSSYHFQQNIEFETDRGGCVLCGGGRGGYAPFAGAVGGCALRWKP